MVTGERVGESAGAEPAVDRRPGTGWLEIWIDGGRPVSAAAVASVGAVCDKCEGNGQPDVVIVHTSGVPGEPLPADLTVGLVSKWERVLRRLERLPAITIAVADGDCGGPALDALLATDYRIASPAVRLIVPMEAGAAWPGMAVYRLARQAGDLAARRAVLFGRPIGGAEALAAHLIDELADDPASALEAAAGAAAALPGAELAIRRQLMLEAPAASFEDALGVHLAACDRALRQAPAQEVPSPG
jgi:isomerase DpgB